MANLEDLGGKPDGRLREGFAFEAGCRAAKRRSPSLRLLSVVGALALTVICSSWTPVAARRDGGGPLGDVYTNGPNHVRFDNGDLQRVAHVSVPAGNYVVHVNIQDARNAVSLSVAVLRCSVASRPGNLGMSAPPTGLRVTLSFTDRVEQALTDIVSLSTDGTIEVTCFSDADDVAVTARLMAILVGTLHQQ